MFRRDLERSADADADGRRGRHARSRKPLERLAGKLESALNPGPYHCRVAVSPCPVCCGCGVVNLPQKLFVLRPELFVLKGQQRPMPAYTSSRSNSFQRSSIVTGGRATARSSIASRIWLAVICWRLRPPVTIASNRTPRSPNHAPSARDCSRPVWERTS
jgi:hypothetical protein